jgi:hypothetical protein
MKLKTLGYKTRDAEAIDSRLRARAGNSPRMKSKITKQNIGTSNFLGSFMATSSFGAFAYR